ncbi:sulfatase [soil metagenome]
MKEMNSWLFCFMAFYLIIPYGLKAQGSKPNILFCIADDASFQHFGANGSKWVNTPNFDRVAREGLLFLNAYTPNAKCAPSRASLLTGRNSWQLEELGNHLAYWPARYKTVWEQLAANNYHAGFTGKGWAPGVAMKINGKDHQLTGKAFQTQKLTPPTSGMSVNNYASNFEDFLSAGEKDKPFIFWFGASEPHRVYEYGSGQKIGNKNTKHINQVYDFWPDNDSVRNDMLDYALEVEYFDQQLGKMLDILTKEGLLENTLILVTSDNGMPFPRIKGQAYEMSSHMPLAMMWKKGIKNPGRKVNDYISFVDIAPTFLEISGTAPPKGSNNKMQGLPLTDIFNAAKSGQVNPNRDHVLLGQERHDVGRPNEVGYPIRSILKNGLMYIHNFEPDRWPAGNPETGYLNTDGGPTKTAILQANRLNPGNDKSWQLGFGKRGAEELYKVKTDPQCLHNLAGKPEFAKTLSSLKTQLFTELKAQNDPRMMGKGYVFDIYPPTEGLNFYNFFLNGERLKTNWVNSADYETDPRITTPKK